MRKKIIIILVVIFALIAGRMIITSINKTNSAKQRKALGAPTVTVDTVKSENVRRQFTATARVMAKYRVEVLARISGYLTKSYFKEGDYVKAATGKDVNYFVGEIDLIVIDSNGIAHVYDFKTSGSDYNLDGHPKDGAQVSSYKQILNQWEVSVDPTGRLITVKVNYNGEIDPKLPEQAVDGFYWSDGKIVDVTESYEFSRNAEKWFPSKKQIKYQEYDPTNDVVEKCWPGASATAKERSLKMDVEEELKSGNVRHIAENDSSYRDGNRLRYYKRGY